MTVSPAPHPIPRSASPGGAFGPVFPFERGEYLAHLRRLSPEDRRSRFHALVDDAALGRHAAQALSGRGRVIGWRSDDVLRAAAEVALAPGGETVESAFEVEEGFRGKGVGTALVGAALLWARNRGARRLIVHTTRRNVPMLRAARRHDAAFEFDLSDAEGVIAAHAPSLRSHMVEAAAVQAALRRAVLRRMRAAGAAFWAPLTALRRAD